MFSADRWSIVNGYLSYGIAVVKLAIGCTVLYPNFIKCHVQTLHVIGKQLIKAILNKLVILQ